MNYKIFVSIVAIAVIVVLVITLALPEIQGDNRIFCLAEEKGTSNWQKTIGYPVLSTYNAGALNFSSLPDVNLGVRVQNNNSFSLFNVHVEVTYKTCETEWKTTESVNIGILDIQQSKEIKITLIEPLLELWDTKRADYSGDETTWEYVSVYVINATDLKITAYGFAEP